MIDKIKETLEKNIEKIINIDLFNKNELYLEVSSDSILDACSFIYSNIECSLISIAANDERTIHKGFALYYVFSVKKASTLLIIKTMVEEGNPEVDSVSLQIPAACLYEREIQDMFGLHFRNIPDNRELIHHGNWPKEVFPLRREFPVNEKPKFEKREQEFIKVTGTGVFEIPVGPVHAGIIEPGHFRFSVAGEPIINLEAKLWYVHKGLEKLAENQSIEKVFYLSERISGDETFTNSLAYCQAVEKIAGLHEVPLRAQYTRVVLAELERLYNHIGDIAGLCVDTAYVFGAGQFMMMRRWCQMLNERITFSRFLRSSCKPGGVRLDFIKGNEKVILDEIEKLEKEFSDSVDILKNNNLFIDRVENTGVLDFVTANDLNAVGPAGRAAGIASDVRVDFPYDAYKKIKVNVPSHNNGDVNCRMNVKIEEVFDSIRMIKTAVQSMPPEGSILTELGKLEPYRTGIGLTEAPRGENVHFVMAAENNTIFRYKIRTPSFCNWPVLCHAVKGNIIPDFPLINKSFNLSYAGNDL